jgi:hypothetical protein
VKLEKWAAPGLGVEQVGELDLGPIAQIQKGKRRHGWVEICRQSARILLRLNLHAGKCVPFSLCFDDPNSLLMNI